VARRLAPMRGPAVPSVPAVPAVTAPGSRSPPSLPSQPSPRRARGPRRPSRPSRHRAGLAVPAGPAGPAVPKPGPVPPPARRPRAVSAPRAAPCRACLPCAALLVPFLFELSTGLARWAHDRVNMTANKLRNSHKNRNPSRSLRPCPQAPRPSPHTALTHHSRQRVRQAGGAQEPSNVARCRPRLALWPPSPESLGPGCPGSGSSVLVSPEPDSYCPSGPRDRTASPQRPAVRQSTLARSAPGPPRHPVAPLSRAAPRRRQRP
jgi:hypothetical protein